MRTSIFIDGFNFYYAAVKGTAHKWLDLRQVFATLLQAHHRITAINYYTAQVSGQRDPQQPLRQQTYWRALQATTPELQIFKGRFLTHPVTWPLAQPQPRQRYATVLKTEEKGSDVNLAVHLLNDAWLDAYDCAVIVSNDSDLAEAMRLVRQQHPAKKLGLVFARHRGGKPSYELSQHAHFVLRLSERVLAACQLPNPIPGTSIHKPASW
ncbi:MAG: NYN domain-containing protein [Burkholderiales bacterium]|nr:NYN domain-containing protein [Burkholderiales bacterium]